MKKRHGLARALEPISREQLQGMNTRALLARLERLRRCEEDRGHSDLSDDEVVSASALILFKADAAWRGACDDVRAELAAREHVERRRTRG